ncbi:GAF domain-containing protein [Flexithrix dorotheae]|uniref:GAF domain-containing protein n=1 Tax=Flexithrix dorotheae TaxID=70993 RepID=UPI00039B8EAA|nr:GAF domain-containing protein [Flexithrix dorotheae]
MIGTFLALGVLLLNYLGLNNLSRVVISILPTLLATVYHGYLAKDGDPWVIGMTLFQVTFSFFPIVIFDLKERVLLLGCLLFNFIQILFFDSINAMLETPVDDYQFREGFVGTIAIILSCLMVYFMVYILTLHNKKSETKTSKILKEMEEKTRKLLDSEEELKNSIATLDKNKIADQKRNWVTEGIAEFSNLLRNTQSSETYDQLLSGLINYIGANQGGLFIVNDGNETSEVSLELVSCYAYDRKKFVEEKFEPGEGLLGQAYLEKEPILLTEVPNDFVSITSGLGEALPSCLLIIPFKFNEEVAGILELASFTVFEDYQVEFVEKLGENIASFIVSARVNEKTKLLLQESQENAEMFRAQEEEVRQNMEELQATQEDMQRVQKDLKAKEQENERALSELEKIKGNLETELSKRTKEIALEKEKMDIFFNNYSNTILFFDKAGKISQVNPIFEKMFGYKVTEIEKLNIEDLFFHKDEKKILGELDGLNQEKNKTVNGFFGKSKMYGFQFPVEITLCVGNIHGEEIITAIVGDISKKLKQEEQMKKNLIALQEAQRKNMASQQEVLKLKKELAEKAN